MRRQLLRRCLSFTYIFAKASCIPLTNHVETSARLKMLAASMRPIMSPSCNLTKNSRSFNRSNTPAPALLCA